ncbi:MAG: hypothetical protein M1330_01510 [Armatimonadetes bacterium]|nr:hypothetical protein [Armatimonadota bacterium]
MQVDDLFQITEKAKNAQFIGFAILALHEVVVEKYGNHLRAVIAGPQTCPRVGGERHPEVGASASRPAGREGTGFPL